jgi:putative N-acetylmannosamine-6-phosphate epimerase
MIDWNEIDKSSEADWVGLAERLIGKAQTILSTPDPDPNALRAAQADLAELVSQATLSCPRSAIDAARRASEQITVFLTALAITDLERRNDKLDAVKARMSSAANELRAQAAGLRLESVQKALTVANQVSVELKGLVTEVTSLTKAEIPDRINAIAKLAQRVIKDLELTIKKATG